MGDKELIKMVFEYFQEANDLRVKIREYVTSLIKPIENFKIKDILLQRNSNSFFNKGIVAYYLHEGLGGIFSDEEKIHLAAGIEVFCSSFMFLDNVIDNHYDRNDETTFLKEYGADIHMLASHYAHHLGLRTLLPFLRNLDSNQYEFEKVIHGMLRMDLEQSKNLKDQIGIIEATNGYFYKVPFIMAATTATEEAQKIKDIGEYGFNLGIGFGIYEEVRDLLGKHGRRRATEVESGRIIVPLHYAAQVNTNFKLCEWVGKELSQEKYKELIQILVETDALNSTRILIKDYFRKASDALEGAVETRCIDQVSPMLKDVEESLDIMIDDLESL